MAALIGVIKNQSQLIALRFLLGVFEAGFSVSIQTCEYIEHSLTP